MMVNGTVERACFCLVTRGHHLLPCDRKILLSSFHLTRHTQDFFYKIFLLNCDSKGDREIPKNYLNFV